MEDIHFYERIVISLKWRAQIYGYLWLYEDEQVDPNALELLTNIAPHLAKNLHQQHHQETNQKQGFIWRLMNDEYLNEAEIFQVAKTVGFIIPKVFNVVRSEEHTSELQSRGHLVCRLLLEKKKWYK